MGENLSVAGVAATAPLVGEPLAEDSFFAMIAGAPKPIPAAGQTGAKRRPTKTRRYAKASPTRRGGIEQSEDDGEVSQRCRLLCCPLKIPSPRAAVKASRCDLISHILHPVSDSFSQLPDTIETVPRRCGRSAPSEPFPLRKEVTSMDNENKWEYDYSSEHSQTGETSYPNVGSSGMNTANTAGTYGEAAQADPQTEPNSGSDAASGRPPVSGRTGKPQAASQKAPPEKRQYRPQRSCTGAGSSHGLCRRLCGGPGGQHRRQGGHPAGGTFLHVQQ